jgi:hypothetical protein
MNREESLAFALAHKLAGPSMTGTQLQVTLFFYCVLLLFTVYCSVKTCRHSSFRVLTVCSVHPCNVHEIGAVSGVHESVSRLPQECEA